MPDGGGQELHCGRDDLTGPLGLVVQVLLAVIAFGALIGKLSFLPISLEYIDYMH